MVDIFISYRREDSMAVAGRLYDRLSEKFGDEHVFMDIEDISAGQNFVEQLGEKLDLCDVMLVLIGPGWLAAGTEFGARRLDDPEDFVHQEVLAALSRNIPLIPVLIGDAAIPASKDLPDSLSSLSQRQASRLSFDSFHNDADRLIAAIKRPQNSEGSPSWLPVLPWIVGFLLICVIGATAFFGFNSHVNLRAEGQVISIAQAKAMLVNYDFYHARWNAAGAGIDHDYEQQIIGDIVVVVDHSTNLMWQSGYSISLDVYTGNLAVIQALNSSHYAGFSDWRMPTLEEVMSLMQAVGEQAISPVFEAGTPPLMTADTTPDGRRWVVSIYDREGYPESANYNSWFKAVRTL